jgi:hypothetical protein
MIGLIGGILSTAAMTITEIPSWKKWGIYGVFEWHENYIITKRLYFRFSNTIEKERQSYFKGIFFFHFLNGTLAGIAFSIYYFLSVTLFFIYHYIVFFIWNFIWFCIMDSYSYTYP